MSDSTAHIDPHWPVDAQDAARKQPSLPLDLGPSVAPELLFEPGTTCHEERPPVLTLSKSEIGVLRRCPRRYQYEYVLGRTPAAGPGIEAAWGTALHRGLETLYEELRSGGGLPARMHWVLDNALTPAADYAPPADPYAKAALRAMLRAYAAAWGADDAARYEVVAVELPFDLPVLTAEGRVSRGRREGARREGRIDAIVRERANRCPACDATFTEDRGFGGPSPCHGAAIMPGRTWIVEHKSTGKPPAEDRFYAGIDLDLQSALYFDAAREMGYEPAGVLYDVIRRPDFDDPKPPPARNKDGSERKAPSEACGACKGTALKPRAGFDGFDPCAECSGTGRVSKQVAYTNPRHGEPAAVYEERVYQLAIAKPGDFFHRRALTIEPWQIEEAREDVRAAALEIAWRTRSEAWPRVGDRYVCAAPRMMCPWIDVCGRRESADDDRLFPLKRKKEIENT